MSSHHDWVLTAITDSLKSLETIYQLTYFLHTLWWTKSSDRRSFYLLFSSLSSCSSPNSCAALAGSPAVTDLLPESLEAVLVADQGYHQVGPADHCSDMFVLSVTVAFATKLEQVRGCIQAETRKNPCCSSALCSFSCAVLSGLQGCLQAVFVKTHTNCSWIKNKGKKCYSSLENQFLDLLTDCHLYLNISK